MTCLFASSGALPVPDGAWAGIAAFYSIVHFSPAELPAVFAEWSRALQPGGLLLLAFHLGAETKHLDEWWGHQADVDFQFFDRKAVRWQLESIGWTVIDSIERPPYGEDVEYPSRRAYIFARNALNPSRP